MITARDAGSVHQRSPHAACVVCLWPASHQRRSPRPSPPPWPGPPPTPCWPPRAPARLNRTGCWVWPAASVATSGPGSSPSAGGCPSTPARLTRSRPRCAVHRPGPALTRTAAHHPSEPEPARHDGSRAAATVRFATQGLRDSANSRASARSVAKFLAGDSGADGVERRIVALGASERAAGADRRRWLHAALEQIGAKRAPPGEPSLRAGCGPESGRAVESRRRQAFAGVSEVDGKPGPRCCVLSFQYVLLWL